jgi:hypothetical protein
LAVASASAASGEVEITEETLVLAQLRARRGSGSFSRAASSSEGRALADTNEGASIDGRCECRPSTSPCTAFPSLLAEDL